MGKRPLTDCPDRLDPVERQRIIAFAYEHCPGFDLERLGLEWRRCRRWHLEHGRQRRRWDLTFENWLENAVRFDEQARLRGRGERVNLDAVELAKVIPLRARMR